jgi:hypothetical protein
MMWLFILELVDFCKDIWYLKNYGWKLAQLYFRIQHPKKLYFSHKSHLFLDHSTYAAKVGEQ